MSELSLVLENMALAFGGASLIGLVYTFCTDVWVEVFFNEEGFWEIIEAYIGDGRDE